MEYKGKRIIESAREQLKLVISIFIEKIYRRLTSQEPDFDNDEVYEFDTEFNYDDEVYDPYTDGYYKENKTSDGIMKDSDGDIFILRDGEDNLDVERLTTDDLERLAVDLEIKYNNLLKR